MKGSGRRKPKGKTQMGMATSLRGREIAHWTDEKRFKLSQGGKIRQKNQHRKNVSSVPACTPIQGAKTK